MPVDEGLDWLLAATDLAKIREAMIREASGPVSSRIAGGLHSERVVRGGLEMLDKFMVRA